MSGPIVRRYGFPNFDQIFGKRELQHGVDDDESPAADAGSPSGEPAPAKASTPKGKEKKKKKS